MTLFSLCLCLYFCHLSTSLLKPPVCQASKPGCGLVLARQWAMQAFFPHSGLLSGVFALTRVQLGLLYPHYWLQVMFWTQSRWPRRGLRYIIVRRGTSGDQTEAAHVLSSLTSSSDRIRQQMLWTQASELLSVKPEREIQSFQLWNRKYCRPSTDKHPCFSGCVSWMAIHAPHILTFSFCSLIRNLNMQSC